MRLLSLTLTSKMEPGSIGADQKKELTREPRLDFQASAAKKPGQKDPIFEKKKKKVTY